MRYLLCFALSLLLAACGQKNPPAADAAVQASLGPVDPEVKTQLENVLQAYFDLKNALVQSDAPKSAAMSGVLSGAIQAVQPEKATEAQRKAWDEISAGLRAPAGALQQSGDLAAQRQHFSEMTQPVYRLVKEFDISDRPVYYDFCPMAFNDQGGYWLSEEKKVFNPYFGDEMLHCGKVRETLD